MSADL